MDNDLTYNKLASNEKEIAGRLLESGFPGREKIREQVFVGCGEVRTPTYQPQKELRSKQMLSSIEGCWWKLFLYGSLVERHRMIYNWRKIMTDVGVRTSPQPTD